MTSEQLFQAGRLMDAIQGQTEAVKAQPGNVAERVFLFELLCFLDEWDRAEKQLDVMVQLDPNQDTGVQPYRNLVAAERQRRRLFTEGLAPVVQEDSLPQLHRLLQAVILLRQQSDLEARELLSSLEDERTPLLVHGQGVRGDDFRDCDDVFASVFEVFVGPQYVWIPMERVRSVQFARPSRPRDLIWAQVNLLMHDSSLVRGFVPVRYFGSGQAPDDEIRLGRRTDWTDSAAGPVLGLGQRTFLVGDDAYGLLDLEQFSLNPAGSESAPGTGPQN